MGIYSLLSRLPVVRFTRRPPLVAVLRLTGVIGSLGPLRSGLTLAGQAQAIERAFKMKRLSAVALSINSPGGSPVQSALLATRIRALADEKEIPVFAFTEDVAASGGYWLACAADEIFADENSIVGSIGVISSGFGLQELIKRIGVERRLHTAGERKAMLDPFKPEDPEDLKRLEAIQQDIHESFKEMVRRRRGAKLKADETTLFNGEFWTGKRARELGLVDGLGELRQVMRQRFGDKVQLKRIGGRQPWWRRRLGVTEALERAGPQPADWAGGLLAAVEERALWSRFGL
ncbi:MAG: S49 family peptidase [Kiloniellales bacterium]